MLMRFQKGACHAAGASKEAEGVGVEKSDKARSRCKRVQKRERVRASRRDKSGRTRLQEN